MSDIRCPNCDAVLSQGELAGGWCDGCGKKIPGYVTASASPSRYSGDVEEPAPAPERLPPLRKPSSNNGLRIVLGVGLVLAVAATALFFIFRHTVDIYVDNGGADPIDVFFDGTKKATIPGNQGKKLTSRAGSYKITVQSAGRTVFDETKTLEKNRRYLLNPDGTNRYWVHTVQYGFAIPNFTFYTDDADRYRKTASQIHLAKPDKWIDEPVDLLFEKPPKTVSGTVTASRKALHRMTRSDYDLIAGAASKQTVTADDQSRLETIVKKLQTSADP